MASNKYFVVKKLSDSTETLVGAPRANLAKLTVVGGKVQAKAATEEQIILHFQAGYGLHEKSREEGDGKMFLISSVPPILVRAKNAGEAISLTDDSTDYEITQASHETIVRLMTAGAQVLTYAEEPKAGAAPAATGNGEGAPGDAAAAGADGSASTGDAAAIDGAVGAVGDEGASTAAESGVSQSAVSADSQLSQDVGHSVNASGVEPDGAPAADAAVASSTAPEAPAADPSQVAEAAA